MQRINRQAFSRFFQQVKSYFYLLVISFGIPFIVSGVMIFLTSHQTTDNSKISPLAENRALARIASPSAESTDEANLRSETINTGPEVIGFLPSWMAAKNITIPLDKLTQLIYFGIGVTADGNLVKYAADNSSVYEWSQFNSQYFRSLRKQAQADNTGVLLAFTIFDNEVIDQLVSNRLATERFIEQALELTRIYNLAGINLNFEYISKTDFPTSKFFNRFLEMVHAAFNKENPNLIISVDLNATAVLKDPAYDMVKIGELADNVILMAYDYHRADSAYAGAVAPLAARGAESSITKSFASLTGRVPIDKIVLGIPFYGYEWQTVNTLYNSPTVPNTGALATYGRVQDLLTHREDVTAYWSDLARSPWLVYRQSGAIKQIYFENSRSLQEKINFAQKNDLGGIAIWALGYEGGYQEPWEVIESYK